MHNCTETAVQKEGEGNKIKDQPVHRQTLASCYKGRQNLSNASTKDYFNTPRYISNTLHQCQLLVNQSRRQLFC